MCGPAHDRRPTPRCGAVSRLLPAHLVRRNAGGQLLTADDRLEAATSRLEDIAQSTFELPQPAVPGLQQTSAPTLPSAAPTPTPPAPTPAPAPPAPAAPPEPVPESIEEFDAFISQSVEKWAKLSNAIGGLVAEQAAKVVQGFREQRRFLLITTKAKKPDLTGADMSVFQDLVKPIGDLMTAVGGIKDSNRGTPLYDNLATVAESIMVLAWVTIDTRPFKHVEESLGAAQFFGNKILTANKNK